MSKHHEDDMFVAKILLTKMWEDAPSSTEWHVLLEVSSSICVDAFLLIVASTVSGHVINEYGQHSALSTTRTVVIPEGTLEVPASIISLSESRLRIFRLASSLLATSRGQTSDNA